ncbi:hypothetical protein ACFLU8_03110 [Chloroflexota bacterium]
MWLALVLISMSWLFSLHLFTSENYPAVAILTLASVAAVFISVLKIKPSFTTFNKKYYLLLLPLAISFLLLPFPYDLGIGLLFVGFLIIPAYKRWHWSFALSLGLFFAGAILIVQSPISHFYEVLTSRSHEFSSLSPLIYRLLDLLNLPVSYSQGTVFVQTMRELHAFTTTWEKIALFPLLNLLVGGGILIWLFSREKTWKRKILSLSSYFVVGVIYLIARYIFMILFFIYLMYFVGYYEDISSIFIFWSPVITALSFLPFWLIVRKLFPLKDIRVNIERIMSFYPLNRRHLIAGALICVSAFLIVGYIGFHDPGQYQDGRVLIDEKHSNWEITTKEYDTEWYGPESGYNYYCMADYLNYYYHVDKNFEVITPDLLSRYDVLILKIPTAPFSSEEVMAIVKFVRGGGGLLLLGEHTNVFGSSAYLNTIAKQFDFSFRYDCLFDIERKFEQVYVPYKILPHPIVQNMPPFLFAVSCSIEPESYSAQNVILASGLKSLDIDYHSSNFYPQVKDAANMAFGSFVQMIAVEHGKGRVVAFTDSTVFSNFSAFIPGKPQLLLGTVNWLNKENQIGWLKYVFLSVAIICLALVYVPLDKSLKDLRFISIVMISIVCTVAISISLFTAVNRAWYPLPEPHTKPTHIYFEKDHSNYELPVLGFVEDHTRSYAIFYQWVLRLGYFPVVGQSIVDSTKEGDLVVIINPKGSFSTEEITTIKEYMSRGGNILLMDDPTNTDSSANSLLKVFDMKIIEESQAGCDVIYDLLGSSSWPIGQGYISAIDGGKPLLFNKGGSPVFAVKKQGKGGLAVLTFSNNFVDSHMGITERVVPNEELRQKFGLEFAIFRGMMNNNLEAELSVGGNAK